ncbi:MAG: type II toxin-antitoxin system VapC family toxin [Anaerolineaceae bacterium]|nr:type II toxin-antitoxin system VapC family toxin [Anaerolineaceae bacterium]
MNYLLDTFVLTEFSRRKPAPKLMRWMDSVAEDSLFISAVTIGELQRSIETLPDSQRKNDLMVWLNEGLKERLKEHILPLETVTFTLWGSLTSWKEQAGKPMGVIETLIAATALRHNLTIVTNQPEAYLRCGAHVVNPW